MTSDLSTPQKRRFNRRRLAWAAVVGLAMLASLTYRPVRHLASVWSADRDARDEIPEGYLDDASRLNLMPVAEVWPIPDDPDKAEKQLRELLERAHENRVNVSIAGARHSMGGHSIARDGLVIDMRPFHGMQLDAEKQILDVQAGARWSEVIPFLNARGLSPAVMQSNNSFTIGGSLSVNCHGWQFDRPPIASTVESFRILLADGRILRCSREENSELFSLVLGGYGLFGVILDARLHVVPNERYRAQQFIVPATEAIQTFSREISGKPDVRMVYARFNISPDRLFEDVILTAFHVEAGDPPPLQQSDLDLLRRLVFRGSATDDYGKSLRWDAETRLDPLLANRIFSRNQIFNEGVELYENRSRETTDILHEYFIPHERAAAFSMTMREIIRRHRAELLNVTIREINEDADSFLRYADQPMFSFVMLFLQERTPYGEQRMQALSRELIDAALAQ
jgi:FAD/FMN-containing dehydrogenase